MVVVNDNDGGDEDEDEGGGDGDGDNDGGDDDDDDGGGDAIPVGGKGSGLPSTLLAVGGFAGVTASNLKVKERKEGRRKVDERRKAKSE